MERFFTIIFASFIGVLAALLVHDYMVMRGIALAFDGFSRALGKSAALPSVPSFSSPVRPQHQHLGPCPPGYQHGVIEADRDGRTERRVICSAPISN